MSDDKRLNSQYSGSDIQILEGLEAVRTRPGMYIGSTSDTGLHHLVREIVDNSIDEALAGYCDHIEVEIQPNGSISVTDNGRGIPVDIHPKTGESALEAVFTVLHAGGKFGGKSYKVSGGLHGVGASVVNALSEWLKVTVFKDGYVYEQEYGRGKKLYNVRRIGITDKTGTVVLFKPDSTIFKEGTEFDYETLASHLQQSAFLNKGLKLTLIDLRNPYRVRTNTYQYDNGIIEYVKYLNQSKTPIHNEIIYLSGKVDNVEVDIAMQYTDDETCRIHSYANNINTPDGGTHEEGFKTRLTQIINQYGKKIGLFKKKESLTGDDAREGLTAIVSVRHPSPEFEGQTKSKLGNADARRIVSQILGDQLEQHLDENPETGKEIINKALESSRARLAAKKAREASRKSPLETIGFASKLSDCRSKDPTISELYLVEGNSAGGSAEMGRDAEFQAILPLRGKVLNVEKATKASIVSNNEIISMIQAIGAGIGKEFDIESVRYHKVVIMTDADVDGAHIRTLLLTFFYRYMRPLIEAGYVYIAQPPLYKVSYGKRIEYAYSEAELQDVLETFNAKPNIQRYKGLGEMNADQLWETTMDPKTRTLLKVKLDNVAVADTVFSMLMGDDVAPRREFIESNAIYVENLDV